MSRAMNDEEVYSEMRKMVAFIKQEALEKAREIKVKADEEFNIEKAKLVRQESVNIENTFERKVKQVEVQKRITQSNMVNKARLRVLARRQELLDGLFAEAQQRMLNLADQSEYQAQLEKFILQGFYKLMDTAVGIECRKSDLEKVKTAMATAKTTYEESTGLTVTPEIDESNFLPENCGGGIIVTSHNGRIRVSNTLESRLGLVSEQMLPEIRVMLFGHSPSRKFFN
ncbi:V-ATPase V1 sector subunit E [Dimargaris cristalligena]|uniref:ATPase, V1/A1 complex, subunit E n=1 Tax=Dimargaris cristalligena TaxID=215637 RepID=A0A4Q0A362_9FUNG|nr:V-ATPase V1 sector subunit E [Dimargaris cristalligena]RKP39832.1 ATPase, V1/A1 complex, subunit E [Dimargaris cristalligena]|eukprot:RKP39832.1 ATPase, V1/A1 complex, subunit E [Dimargaris cristalligena]